jgi:hypothetical protein
MPSASKPSPNRIASIVETAPVLSKGTSPQDFFEGPSINEIIQNFISEKVRDAKEQGKREARKEIQKKAQTRLGAYLKSILNVGYVASRVAMENLQDFKVQDYRTKIDPTAQQINLLYVINTTPESEYTFCGILNAVEDYFLQSEKLIVESISVNERDKQINFDCIESDFPHSLRIDGVINAKRGTTRRPSDK